MNAAAPAWQPDPTGRHELRYWDGTRWTDHVSDRGTTATDPVGSPPSATQHGPQPGPTAAPQSQPGQPAQPPATQQRAGFPAQPGPGATVQQPAYGQGPPSGGYGAGGPSGGEHFAGGDGSGPGSGLSTGLLVGLGVLVLVLIGGIVFVLTSKDDDEPDDRTDDTTSTTSTTESTTTTVDDTTSDQVVEEFATAIHEGSDGNFTLDQARCMAAGILDVIGLERLAEVRIEAGDDAAVNPVDLLTEEEQTAAFDVMRDCVPAGTIDEQPTEG